MNCNCQNCAFEVKNLQPPLTKDLFFEVHITVDEGRLEEFKTDCLLIGVKPILLDLYTNEGDVIKDLMTSSVHKCETDEIFREAEKIVTVFKNRGYNVSRVKIETVPWHPDAPSVKNPRAFNVGQYFESHLAIKCKESDIEKLQKITRINRLHLSKNVFKKNDGEIITIMATLRWYYGVIEDFKEKLSEMKALIQAAGFEIEKEIVEFTWFDSKIDHDNIWIGLGTTN